MEAAEIPVYSLSEILNMHESHISIFLSTLGVPASGDARGQIALALDSLGKLSYSSPINGDNLRGLIKVTTPSEITKTKEVVRAAGVMPSVNRSELMKQYLSYAMVPLAESPRFLPVVRPASPRLSIIRPTSPRPTSPRTPVSAGFEAIPETKPALPLVTLEAEDWRTELTALINFLNKFSGEVIQQIVKNYNYRRIQKICQLIPKVLADESLEIPSTVAEKLRNLNELLCDSQFFWHLKTQHDFGVTYATPPRQRTWKQEYKFRLIALERKFRQAVSVGNVTTVQEFLDYGIDPDAQDLSGDTALIKASVHGYVNIVRSLLNYGAAPNIQNLVGATALMRAARFGHYDVVQLLLDHGAEVNTSDYQNDTALIRASIGGHTNVARLLLARGADPNIQNYQGDTALIKAVSAEYGLVELVELLLDYGADANIRNVAGRTARDLARWYSSSKELMFLLEQHAQ